MPIPVPDGTEVRIDGPQVVVKGPKGTLERTFPEGVEIALEDGVLVCRRQSENRQIRARHGLVRALLNNMVTGVTTGFRKALLLQGIGYRATVDAGRLSIVAGHSHDVVITVPEGLEVVTEQVSANPPVHRIAILGPDKEQVGQFAADIRSLRPVEPYKLKGLRYETEIVRKKAGKAAAGG